MILRVTSIDPQNIAAIFFQKRKSVAIEMKQLRSLLKSALFQNKPIKSLHASISAYTNLP